MAAAVLELILADEIPPNQHNVVPSKVVKRLKRILKILFLKIPFQLVLW